MRKTKPEEKTESAFVTKKREERANGRKSHGDETREKTSGKGGREQNVSGWEKARSGRAGEEAKSGGERKVKEQAVKHVAVGTIVGGVTQRGSSAAGKPLTSKMHTAFHGKRCPSNTEL